MDRHRSAPGDVCWRATHRIAFRAHAGGDADAGTRSGDPADRDSQVARADMSAEGQQITLFYDQALGRTYYPNSQGGYWYADGSEGEAFIAALKPVEWLPRQLEEAGFAHETLRIRSGLTFGARQRQRRPGADPVYGPNMTIPELP